MTHGTYPNPQLDHSGNNVIDGKIYSATSSSVYDNKSINQDRGFTVFNWKTEDGDSGDMNLSFQKVYEGLQQGTFIDLPDSNPGHLGYSWSQINFPTRVHLEQVQLYLSSTSVRTAFGENAVMEDVQISEIMVCGKNDSDPEQPPEWKPVHKIDMDASKRNKFVNGYFVSPPGLPIYWSEPIFTESGTNQTDFYKMATFTNIHTEEKNYSSYRFIYTLTKPLVRNDEGFFYNPKTVDTDQSIPYCLSEVRLTVSDPEPSTGTSADGTGTGTETNGETGGTGGSASTNTSSGSLMVQGNVKDSGSSFVFFIVLIVFVLLLAVFMVGNRKTNK